MCKIFWMQQRMHMPCPGWERCFSRQEAQHQEQNLTPPCLTVLCSFPSHTEKPRARVRCAEKEGIPSFQGITVHVTSNCRLEPHSAKHSQLGLLGSARNCFRKQQHNPNIYLQYLTWTLSRSQCEEGISTRALSTARKVSERCDRSQSGHTEWDHRLRLLTAPLLTCPLPCLFPEHFHR